MLAAPLVGIGITEQFDEDASLDVVGEDLRRGAVEPERPRLLEHVGAQVRHHREAALVLLGHAGGHLLVVGHLDVGHPVARNSHRLADLREISLRPVDGARGLHQGARYQHLLGEEGVILANLQDGIGGAAWRSARALGFSPDDLDQTRLGREHHPGIRTPVVGRPGMVVGAKRFGRPIILRAEVPGGQQDAELIGIRHRDDRAEQEIDPAGHHRAADAGPQEHMGRTGSAQPRQIQTDRIGHQASVGVEGRRTGGGPTDPHPTAEAHHRLVLPDRRSPGREWRQLAADGRRPTIGAAGGVADVGQGNPPIGTQIDCRRGLSQLQGFLGKGLSQQIRRQHRDQTQEPEERKDFHGNSRLEVHRG